MAMSAESGAGDPTRISAEVQAWVFTARCCGGGQHLRRNPWGGPSKRGTLRECYARWCLEFEISVGLSGVTSTTWRMWWAFIIVHVFFLPPAWHDMLWQGLYILDCIVCMYIISHFRCGTVHFKTNLGQHCGETYWFKFDVGCSFWVWYVSLLQCRCSKSFRILWKQPSKASERTWPKIWHLKFAGGWGRALLIENQRYSWLRMVQEDLGPQDTTIDFYSVKAWSLQVIGFEELPDRLLLIGVPYPVGLSATHLLHIIYLVGQALGCNWFWTRGKSSGLCALESGRNPANSYTWMFQAHKKDLWNRHRRQILAESHLILFVGLENIEMH